MNGYAHFIGTSWDWWLRPFASLDMLVGLVLETKFNLIDDSVSLKTFFVESL
jgi:hypothetical protein